MTTRKSTLEALKTTKTSKSPKATLSTATPSSGNHQKAGCCMGATPCPSTAQSTVFKPTPSTTSPSLLGGKKGPKTRIIIKYDVGFNNSLSLRGKGANLSWDRGVSLKNVKPDEWVWETETSFATCEFKVLINDRQYEAGNNHTLACGASIQYTPKF